jgi:glycerophosphoryl diester phosphodiesterase
MELLLSICIAGCAVACSKPVPPSDDTQATAPAPAASPKDATMAETTWTIKAHRGASFDAPENTAAAVTLAFERGAKATEIDVRIAKDGAVVVFHDEDTKRIGGRDKLVRDQTLTELKELDIGAWKGPTFAGERIVTLAALVAQLPEGVRLFVEIKDGAAAVPAVLEVIVTSGKIAQIAIESFDEQVVALVRELQPSIPIHLTVGSDKDEQGRPLPFDLAIVKRAVDLGASGLAVDVRGVTPEFAKAVRAAGLELGVWTVNDPSLAQKLRGLPITWLETDRPGLFRDAHKP